MKQILIGMLVVGLIVAGVTGGFQVADYSYQKGYSSGYALGYSKGEEVVGEVYQIGYQEGRASCPICDCEDKMDILFKQGFFAGYCTYYGWNHSGQWGPAIDTGCICNQFNQRYMMPYYADSEEYTGFFMCSVKENRCRNVWYDPPCEWRIEDPEA